MGDSFSTAASFTVHGREYRYWSLPKLGREYDIGHLPFSLKILLENLLRNENGIDVTHGDIEALCRWDPQAEQYLMYWFDSMGGRGSVSKGCLEGDVLTFQSTSPMGHHRYRYTFEGAQTVFEMAMSEDGEAWQTMMVGRYRSEG